MQARTIVMALVVAVTALVVPATAGAEVQAAGALTISVSPNRHLLDRDIVRVTGTGVTPASPVRVYECPRTATARPVTNGRCVRSGDGVAGAEGRYRVSAKVTASTFDTATQKRTLCQWNECSLVTVQVDAAGHAIASAAAPVAFAPGLSISTTSPTTGLNGGETIVVRVSGLRQGVPFRLGQCLSASATSCGGTRYVAGAHGVLVVPIENLQGWTYDVPPGGPNTIHACRPPGHCSLVAWRAEGDGTVPPDEVDVIEEQAIPLGFTGGQIAATFTPTTNLIDRQTVTITGRSKGAKGRDVEVRQTACSATDCLVDQTLGFTTIRADGTFTVTVKVLSDPPRNRGGSFDCASPALRSPVAGCEVSAWVDNEDGSFDRSRGNAHAALYFTQLPVQVSIGSISVKEGTGGQRPAIVPIKLSRPADVPIMVKLHTVDDLATAPGDFTATSKTVTIPAGQTSATLWIPLVTDAVAEPTEDFIMQGDTVSAGAIFVRSRSFVIIVDDD